MDANLLWTDCVAGQPSGGVALLLLLLLLLDLLLLITTDPGVYLLELGSLA